jgi:hypothetical protein
LAVLAAFALMVTPPVERFMPGPTPLEVELHTANARADDLAAQNRKLTEKLRRPRPIAADSTSRARADDLKRQVQTLERKLGEPGPATHLARANDLQRRLRNAEERLRQPRPNPGDPAARARAEDLARQNDRLNAELTKPRPAPDPLANVTASMTRDEIAAADRLFGLYTNQAPFDYGEVDLVQSTVRRKANVVGYFGAWTEDFRADAVKQVWLRGQIPLLTWEPQSQVGTVATDQPDYALPRILDGTHDDYIRRYAQAITATGLPLIVRFAHEMNGNWYPWSEGVNGNGEGDYVKAWRHVHAIFEAEGANRHVVWLWAPNRINQIRQRPAPEAFYPGDDVVDWIGMSGYYRPYDDEANFENTYGQTLPLLRDAADDKPIFLAEIGATEENNHKQYWIADLFRGMVDNPDIVGFAWFSLTVTSTVDGERQTNDWRINSSGGAADVMADELAASGYGIAP